VSAVNPLGAFYDVHGRKDEVRGIIFLYSEHEVSWMDRNLRISNKYGKLARNKFLMKVALPRNNMTYIQNTNHIRGCKLTIADWFNFRMIEELMYEKNV
jgi:hypothetical protein